MWPPRALLACLLCLSVLAEPPARAADLRDPAGEEGGLEGVEPAGEADEEEEEVEELRDRLTEREDRRRVPDPWSTRIAGHPLIVEGELESELRYARRRILDPEVREPDRLLLEQGLELETFYTLGSELSFFLQLRLAQEEDLLGRSVDPVSSTFAERGEMWVYSEDIAGSHLNLDAGRLHFEDDRRWWWDDEIDAVRLAYERDRYEIVISLARELGSDRTDQSFVDPEHDRVLRLIGEASWDWSENHALELFVLRQSDHSPTERVGESVRSEREDDEDARLTWLGVRAMGVTQLDSRGILGYWLDAALVRGREQRLDFEDVTPRRSEVAERMRRDVRGYGFDAGVQWILPTLLEPRLFAGYAFGSGDSHPERGSDRSFRQTGLEANEAGFGGVERFNHYGVLLEPELSNLGVLMLGFGLSLLRSSSLDVVYHHYRLADPAPSLRDAEIEAELDGRHRGLGQALDVVLAVEEWQHFELTLIGSAFRAGRAFGTEHGTWSYGAFLSLRFPF